MKHLKLVDLGSFGEGHFDAAVYIISWRHIFDCKFFCNIDLARKPHFWLYVNFRVLGVGFKIAAGSKNAPTTDEEAA